MIARIVTIPIKAGSGSEFARIIENEIIPLLRTYKGFQDEIAMVGADGKTSVGISLWDNKQNAEAYARSGYERVLKALAPVTAASAQVQFCDVTNSTVHKLAAAAGA